MQNAGSIAKEKSHTENAILQKVKPHTKKHTSKAKARTRTITIHSYARLAVQIVFFIVAPGVFASAMSGIRIIFSDLGTTQPIDIGSFIVILVASLGYTVVFGRFFCGYACAFGTMGDVLYQIGRPVRKLLHIEGKPIRGALVSVLQWLKFAILVAICTLCFTGQWNSLSAHDPWSAFGLAVGGTFTDLDHIGVVLLIAIMVFQLLFERSFCRFLCPLGAVFALMPIMPFSQYGRKIKRCGKKWCNRCIDNCPAGIYPDKGSNVAGECFACGRCADVCPVHNVHLVGEAQSRALKDKKHLTFTGNQLSYVLIRALILLGVLWLLGATRFVPDAVTTLSITLPWS